MHDRANLASHSLLSRHTRLYMQVRMQSHAMIQILVSATLDINTLLLGMSLLCAVGNSCC